MSWKEADDQLIKEFTMDGFTTIMNKLPQVAEKADAMHHHPDFEVYGYKNIRFKLSTHSEGKVTDKDHELAAQIDQIFSS